MKDNERCRAAYNAVLEVLSKEHLYESELDALTETLGILYSRLPEAQ